MSDIEINRNKLSIHYSTKSVRYQFKGKEILKTFTLIKNIAVILIICLMAMVSISKASAQTVINGKLSGKVFDQQKKPISYVSIALLKAKDSTLVKGSLTDDNGNYVFSNIPDGNYLMAYNMVGYIKVFKGPYIISIDHQAYQIDDVQLTATSKQLNSVNIVSRKPLIETQIDKTVLNIENSILATGNTALEILQKAPGVTVDKDGNISLRGKQGVTVMLDGKPTYLSNEQLTDLLNATEGDAIQSIELMTNPSSKYDAAGNAGIINIKLKKNSNYGTNGSIMAGTGYGRYYKANTGLTLNHREKKFNVFGNLDYGNNKRFIGQTQNRLNTNGTDQTFFDQQNQASGIRNNTNYKTGIDYFINEKNTIGVAVNGSLSNGNDNSNPITKIGSKPMEVDSIIRANNPDQFRYNNITDNLNYKGLIDTSGQEINVNADYSVYKRSKESDYNNNFFNTDGQSYKSEVFRDNTPSTIKIWAAQADYTYPFSKKMKLDAGVKSSFVNTDNNSIFENYIDNSWQNDVTQSNHFTYSENINAVYANLKREFTNTTVQIGLRAEETNSKGNSITTQSATQRNYLNLFPSFFVKHELSPDNEIGFSYSRRIDRPNYQSLNPFIHYIDLYTYYIGNPLLNPQYTNSFEVSYAYKKTLNVTLGYSRTSNLITEIILSDTVKKTLFDSQQNLAKKDSYNLNINSPLGITKWWNTNNNLLIYYNKYSSPEILGVPYSKGKMAFSINTIQTITINSTMSTEGILSYQSSEVEGTAYNRQYYSVDLGINKSLDNKKFSIKFAVNDVFNTLAYKLSSALPTQSFLYYVKPEGRIFRLTGTYRFGSSKIKSARQHTKGLEDEQKRVGT